MKDITARRHRGNPESSAAFQAIKYDMPAARRRVLETIRKSGVKGMTCDEVGRALGLPPNVISGRMTELKRDSAIHDTGLKRRTAAGQFARAYAAI